MQTDHGCQGGVPCYKGLFARLTSTLTASHSKANPDGRALTWAGASVCISDLQELRLFPDKLHRAGVELAGQVYLVGDGEHLSQSRAAPAWLLPVPCFLEPWRALPCAWLRHDMPLSALQVGAAIWVSHTLHAIAWSSAQQKRAARLFFRTRRGLGHGGRHGGDISVPYCAMLQVLNGVCAIMAIQKVCIRLYTVRQWAVPVWQGQSPCLEP